MNALNVCRCTFCENIIFQKRFLPQVAFSGEGGLVTSVTRESDVTGGAPTDRRNRTRFACEHFELKQRSVLATSKATQTSRMSTTQQIWAPKICPDYNGSTLTTSAKKQFEEHLPLILLTPKKIVNLWWPSHPIPSHTIQHFLLYNAPEGTIWPQKY